MVHLKNLAKEHPKQNAGVWVSRRVWVLSPALKNLATCLDSLSLPGLALTLRSFKRLSGGNPPKKATKLRQPTTTADMPAPHAWSSRISTDELGNSQGCACSLMALGGRSPGQALRCKTLRRCAQHLAGSSDLLGSRPPKRRFLSPVQLLFGGFQPGSACGKPQTRRRMVLESCSLNSRHARRNARNSAPLPKPILNPHAQFPRVPLSHYGIQIKAL